MLSLKKTPAVPVAPAIMALRMPAPVVSALAAVTEAFAQRSSLERLANELAASEPAARTAASQARAAVDAVEVDIALDDDAALADLRTRLAAARAVASDADDAVALNQGKQRGVTLRMPAADATIEATAVLLAEALAPFRDDLIEILHGDFRDAAAHVAKVTRASHAVNAAINNLARLRSVLDDITIRDVKSHPGRPTPFLLQGNRAWLDEDGDIAGENMRESWGDDPALRSLHELLQPVDAAERQIAAHRRRIAAAAVPPNKMAERVEAELARARQAAPAAPPEPPVTREQLQRESAERANASRIFPAPGPRPSWHGFGSRPAPAGPEAA